MQGIEPPYTDPYVRWCERSTSQLMASLLLDSNDYNFSAAIKNGGWFTWLSGR
ncbi:hypothetical protein [Dolosigranulum pigrum]|uniref:hypothetical protein n=1 Tax=Dolosigranulum pigrum TaxID=29394 RepID=UPI001AD86E0D|nr:hypothetical protein [Dolosigranulum pigrum]